MSTFEIRGGEVLSDGRPFRIFSGAMHYFRIHPALWEDRFRKMKAMGLNMLETYTAWNVHEPERGTFCFDGFGDLERYLQMAGDFGFKVLIRPGPYICSEWEFGALPGWLTAIPGLRIRCDNQPYLDEVARYFRVLLPKIRKFSCADGGPVVAVQVENEYGSYGNDKTYLKILSSLLSEELPGILQLTSDGPNYGMLSGGTLPGIWATGNFGSRAAEQFAELEKFRPGAPLMCCEFWNGWFDHWGETHHTRTVEEAEKSLREILERGGHVNFYMFHGGTNFGFYNGANHSGPGKYEPTVSSYDDDAPLNENGGITPKYKMFRRVLKEYGASVPDEIPPTLPIQAYGPVRLTDYAPLLENAGNLADPVRSAYPTHMEELGQNFGLILYRHRLRRSFSSEGDLTIDEPRDRAQVFLNSSPRGTVYCNDKTFSLKFDAAEGDILDVLVENMGRSNYGPYMERNARKGITDGVRHGNQFFFDWTVYPLKMNDLSSLNYRPVPEALPQNVPCFYRGKFRVDQPADTFLKIPGKKGFAFINGFNLGRYWEIGPTHTLYLPAPLLKKGENILEILELHTLEKNEAMLQDTPEL